MCELKARNDISDCIDIANSGVQTFVGQDEATFHANTGLFKAEPFGDGTASDGNQENICIKGLAIFSCNVNAEIILSGACKTRIGVESDSTLAERTFKVLGNGFVFVIRQVWKRLDDGDFRAERTPHRGKLEANNATTKNNCTLRDPLHLECLIRCDDSAADIESRN